jgi:hypothetical protein
MANNTRPNLDGTTNLSREIWAANFSACSTSARPLGLALDADLTPGAFMIFVLFCVIFPSLINRQTRQTSQKRMFTEDL